MLILLIQLERAGAQKNAFAQANHFHRIGYDVTYCVFYDKYNIIEEVRKKVPFKITSLEAKVLGDNFLLNFLRTVRAMWRLFRLMKKKKIDIIETLTQYSNIIGISIAWLADVPVRISSQRSTLNRSLTGFNNRFQKYFLALDALIVNSPLVDKMISVSETTRRYCIEVEGIKSRKIVTIKNGVNLAKFNKNRWNSSELNILRDSLGIPEKATLLLTTARLSFEKGHIFLIQAAPMVLELFPETLFLLAGEGQYRPFIEREIRQSCLQDKIILLGSIEDVPALLAMSELFVLPSIVEGMPNSVLEAMAARLPIVATAVDGTKELLVDRVSGLLVPPKNSRALADAIISLLKDKQRAREMAKRAYKRTKDCFSEDFMCKRYERVIQAAVKRKQEI